MQRICYDEPRPLDTPVPHFRNINIQLFCRGFLSKRKICCVYHFFDALLHKIFDTPCAHLKLQCFWRSVFKRNCFYVFIFTTLSCMLYRDSPVSHVRKRQRSVIALGVALCKSKTLCPHIFVMHHLVESECEARMAQLSYIHTN